MTHAYYFNQCLEHKDRARLKAWQKGWRSIFAGSKDELDIIDEMDTLLSPIMVKNQWLSNDDAIRVQQLNDHLITKYKYRVNAWRLI